MERCDFSLMLALFYMPLCGCAFLRGSICAHFFVGCFFFVGCGVSYGALRVRSMFGSLSFVSARVVPFFPLGGGTFIPEALLV